MKYLEPVKKFLRRGYVINESDGVIQIHKEGILSNRELPIKPWNFNNRLFRKIERYDNKFDVNNIIFFIHGEKYDPEKEQKIIKKIDKRPDWKGLYHDRDMGFV